MATRVTRSNKSAAQPSDVAAVRRAAQVEKKKDKNPKKKTPVNTQQELDRKNATFAKLEREDAREVAARQSVRVKNIEHIESKPLAGKKRTRASSSNKTDVEHQADDDVVMDDFTRELLDLAGDSTRRDASSPSPEVGDSELTPFESEAGIISEPPIKKQKMLLRSTADGSDGVQPAPNAGANQSADSAPPLARTLRTPQTPIPPKPRPARKGKKKEEVKYKRPVAKKTTQPEEEPADVDMLEGSDAEEGAPKRAAKPTREQAKATAVRGENKHKTTASYQPAHEAKTTGRIKPQIKSAQDVVHDLSNDVPNSDSESDVDKHRDGSPAFDRMESSCPIQDENTDSVSNSGSGSDFAGSDSNITLNRKLYSSRKDDLHPHAGMQASYSFSDEEEITVKVEEDVIDIDYSEDGDTVPQGGRKSKPKPQRKAVESANTQNGGDVEEDAPKKSMSKGSSSTKPHCNTTFNKKAADMADRTQSQTGPNRVVAVKKESKSRTAPTVAQPHEEDMDEDDDASAPLGTARPHTAATKQRQSKDMMTSDNEVEDPNGPMPTPTRSKLPIRFARPPRGIRTSSGLGGGRAPPKPQKAASRVPADENNPDLDPPAHQTKIKETHRLPTAEKDNSYVHPPVKKEKEKTRGKLSIKSEKKSEKKPEKMSLKGKSQSQNDDLDVEDYDGYGYVNSGDEEVEELAAAASPSKIGKRMTSSSLVKVEDPKAVIVKKKPSKSSSSSSSKGNTPHNDVINVDSSRESTSAPSTKPGRTVYKNSDLPKGAHDQNRWRGIFIPTFLTHMGTLDDPWTVNDHKFLHLLQELWNAVYGSSVDHEIEIGDCVHYLASQRMYEWRCTIGLHAVRVFENFFKSSDARGKYNTDKDRAEYCRHILRHGRLFYENPLSDNCEGLYLSNFVLGPLSHHIEVSQGAIKMPSLYSSRKDEYPFGALALSATAAFRAAKLYQEQKVSWNAGQLVIAKGHNSYTGKESKDTNFGYQQFGHITQQCLKSVKALTNQQLKSIYRQAEQELQTTPTASTQGPDEEFDFSALVDKRKPRD
ncbi:hypothetical protein C8Q80DRAFT_1267961 [Daedaleopsis nitida]|nr:hypothetical protein C8Q80DRAFT_1267961 [Daedaleopsis nitida]